MTLEQVGEVRLIEEISRVIGRNDQRVLVPVGDDAAVCQAFEHLTVLTTDMLVDRVHFNLVSVSPYQLGYKSLAINLSDIAAMAGLPRYALVALGLPPHSELEWVLELYRGMRPLAESQNVTIVGGDISKSSSVTISVTVVGEVERAMLRRRSDAKVGDRILVTGQLGAATAGFSLLESGGTNPTQKRLVDAHLFPIPRIREARAASRAGARAVEDISDGLAKEIVNIARASKAGAMVIESKIPVAPGVDEVAMGKKQSGVGMALAGGEDYELVMTAPRSKVRALVAAVEGATKTRVTDIGEITGERSGMVLVSARGDRDLGENAGYDHFKGSQPSSVE